MRKKGNLRHVIEKMKKGEFVFLMFIKRYPNHALTQEKNSFETYFYEETNFE
jgi:hypothetical protein